MSHSTIYQMVGQVVIIIGIASTGVKASGIIIHSFYWVSTIMCDRSLGVNTSLSFSSGRLSLESCRNFGCSIISPILFKRIFTCNGLAISLICSRCFHLFSLFIFCISMICLRLVGSFFVVADLTFYGASFFSSIN